MRVANPQRQPEPRRYSPTRPPQRQPTADTDKPQEPQPVATRRGPTWALGLALFAFGAIGWILGGMFTFDGWVSWLNGFFGIVRLPFVLPMAAGLWRLLFIPIAVIYSYVETRNRPVRRGKDGRWHVEKPLFWVGFILITLTDIGSTAVGIQTTQPADWGALAPTVAWITASRASIGTTATILTFAPEWLILGGVWLLKR